MAKKKSKALGELSRLQKMSQASQNSLASLEQKLRKESFPFDGLVVSPAGEVKMSEVLEDFVEPYRESAQTEKEIRRLLTLATVAWNASFIPPEGQQEMIDQLFTDELVEGDQELRAEIQDLIRVLIGRKNRYFSQYSRMIVDFELTDTGNGYHLSVASTLDN
jgi:hypothetical protein